MEHSDNAMEMLELHTHPVFCVQGGIITYANTAARQRGIETDSEILPMLVTGTEEYQNFTDGCLSLHICIADTEHEAFVTKHDNSHIFSIPQKPEASELQAMALAAQELRQPLSNILTVTDQLFPTTVEDTPAATQQVSQLNRGLYQLLRIVTNMSDAYRYSCQAETQMQTVNLKAVFDELAEKAAGLLTHTSLKLHYHGLSRDMYGLANEEMLTRAVYNLISNAIKFSPNSGDIHINVRENGKLLYVSVQDQGQGIPSQIQSTVFSRYLRQPGIEDGRFGIGLGMALVRDAAAAHGGTVLLDKPGDSGCRFTMSLALKKNKNTILRTNPMRFDPLGGMDLGLIQLSDALPAEEYRP